LGPLRPSCVSVIDCCRCRTASEGSRAPTTYDARLRLAEMLLSILGMGGHTPDFAPHAHLYQSLGPEEACEARVFPLPSSHAQNVCSSLSNCGVGLRSAYVFRVNASKIDAHKRNYMWGSNKGHPILIRPAVLQRRAIQLEDIEIAPNSSGNDGTVLQVPTLAQVRTSDLIRFCEH